MPRVALAVLPSAEPSPVIPFDRAQRRATTSEIQTEIDALWAKARAAQARAEQARADAKALRRALLTVVK